MPTKSNTSCDYNLCWMEHKGNPIKSYNLESENIVYIQADMCIDEEEPAPWLEIMFVDDSFGSYPGGWPDNQEQLVTMALALKDMCKGFENVRIDWDSIADTSRKWQAYLNANK